MSDYLLYTKDMVVGYDKKPLIKNIAIGVDKGKILTLIGPNGAGKSTILKSITRQLALLGGNVVLEGKDMSLFDGRDLARKLALVTTERVRPELMTCLEVVAMGRYPYTGRLGILSAEDKAKARDSLSMVHGTELAEKDFSRISDGQRQRVMLARALCQEPEIIILDEPTSFLDIRYKLELLDILKGLAREKNLAVIMSLHELDLAQKISDTVVCVNGDRVDRCGPPEEIFTSDYIHDLYDVSAGSYNGEFGSLELAPPKGKAKVFVIGGAGSGIPVYRRLQREGIPFAAGVLHKNDLDYPVAQALAEKVVAEEAFEFISEEKFQEAQAIMLSCEQVLCPLKTFGTLNAKNKELLKLAEEHHLLKE